MLDDCRVEVLSADAPQRMSLLVAVPTLLAEFGASLDAVLDGLPIDKGAFADQEVRIPYWAASRMLDRCSKVTKCPHFGLLLGARFDHRCLGFPGQWMANAPDLGSALSGFIELQNGNSRGGSAYFRRSGDCWVFGYGVYEPKAVAQEQIYPLMTALMVNLVKALTGGAVKPAEVLLSTRQPANAGPYRALLGGEVLFNQQESGVVLPPSALTACIPGARSSELEHLRKLAAAMAPPSDRPWTDRVKHAVRPLLLRDEPTAVSMAAFLRVNVRTLARYLEKEGASFQPLLDETRYLMARELLQITELPVGDVADALSYSSHSNFGEAFRRWSGITPSQWRSRARAPAHSDK